MACSRECDIITAVFTLFLFIYSLGIVKWKCIYYINLDLSLSLFYVATPFQAHWSSGAQRTNQRDENHDLKQCSANVHSLRVFVMSTVFIEWTIDAFVWKKKADALFILGMVFVPASLLPAGACLDTMRNWFRARVNEGHFLVTQQSSPFSLLGRSLFQEFSLFRFFFLLFVRLAK